MDKVVMQVSCPGCEAVFELPPEVAGQAGECTECGSIFEIPSLQELGLELPGADETAEEDVPKASDTQGVKPAAPPPAPKPGVGKQMAPEAAETTNTIKLSRSSIGMIPDLSGRDDGFKVDIVQRSGAAQQSTRTTNKKVFSKTRTSIPKPQQAAGDTDSAANVPKKSSVKKDKKPWWQFWMFWK